MPPINAACCGCVNYDKSTAEVFLRCTGCGTMWKDTALRQQLAEARATIEAKTATIDAAEQTITRLEKAVDALVVQREGAFQQLAAQAAELERMPSSEKQTNDGATP